MSQTSVHLQESAVRQHCKGLHLPTVAGGCLRLADEAEREHQGYLGYLEALLQAEIEEREQNAVVRRIKDAHLPKVKTLEEFDFGQAPAISATRIAELAGGGYIDRAEPVVFIGECGTGKMHLLTGLWWLPVGRSGGCASPRRQDWSTSWWRPSSSSGCVACWRDGTATT